MGGGSIVERKNIAEDGDLSMQVWKVLFDDVADNLTDILEGGHEGVIFFWGFFDDFGLIGNSLSMIHVLFPLVKVVGMNVFWCSLSLR